MASPRRLAPAALLVVAALGHGECLRAQSAPRWIETWDRCVASAKVDAKPILLLVTAPEWDPGSRPFEQKVLGDTEVLRAIAAGYRPYRIEIAMRDDKKARALTDQERDLVRSLRFYGHQGLPRVILIDPGMHVYGRTGPVGTAEDFLAALADWEEARKTTLAPTVDEAAAARYANDAAASRNLKNPARAADEAALAVKADPRSPRAHFTLALVLQDLGKLAEAKRSYFAALSLDCTGNPKDATSTIWAAGGWYNLGGMALAQKQEAKAIFYMRENQRTDHRTDAPMLRVAELHAAASRPELGVEDYGELLSRDGLSPDWLKNYLALQDLAWKAK
ncbi:MAG: hypothetical protein WAT39_08845 [Planctomycetota bacterium]